MGPAADPDRDRADPGVAIAPHPNRRRPGARAEGGLGIDLTLARELLEMHGGTLTAASDGPGLGSTFTVSLPAADPPADGPRVEGSSPRAVEGRPAARVLVVDDNVDLARGLTRLVEMLGHAVATAYDGPEAIATARRFRPDVVLLDIGLPGMDGYEVAARLRLEECCRESRIVAVTGYGHEEDRRRSREAGFDFHVVKPLDFSTLADLIAGDPGPAVAGTSDGPAARHSG